jgi:hypothetical protein
MAKYVPPKQSKASQFFDVIVLVVLIVGACSPAAVAGHGGRGKDRIAAPVADPTWETLGQNAGAGRAIRSARHTDPAESAR